MEKLLSRERLPEKEQNRKGVPRRMLDEPIKSATKRFAGRFIPERKLNFVLAPIKDNVIISPIAI